MSAKQNERCRWVVQIGTAALAVIAAWCFCKAFQTLASGNGPVSGESGKMEAVMKDENPRVERTPPGPAWPAILDFKVSKPQAIRRGEAFKVTVSMSPTLFDVSDLTVRPLVSGKDLRSLAQDAVWSGSLKKGESKSFTFELVAQGEGFNGQYGVRVESKSVYAGLREYVKKQSKGPYAAPADKDRLRRVIDQKERSSPVYRTACVLSIHVGKGKEE